MVKIKNKVDLFHSIYYNSANPASYSSVYKLYKEAKKVNKNVTLRDAKNFLLQSETYTKFTPIRKKVKTNKWIATFVDSHHHGDLAFFNKITKFNKGFSYLLVIVDVLSRFIMTFPLKSKTVNEVSDAYKTILETSGRVPRHFVTDRGGEFCGSSFQKLLKEKFIHHIIPKNTDVKANYAENAIMRIKCKLVKYFSAQNTLNWVDNLKNVVDSLNGSFLNSIGMCPKDVNPTNCFNVMKRLYEPSMKKRAVFKIGDCVRLRNDKGHFGKGTNQKYTEEVFIVHRIIYDNFIPCYVVIDQKGQEIDAFFYPEELQLFIPKVDQTYAIEKIIRKRKVNGKYQYYVKWRGYDKSFNQWVSQSDIVNHNGR